MDGIQRDSTARIVRGQHRSFRGATFHRSDNPTLQVVDQDLVIVGHPKGVRSFAIIGADRRQMTGRWQLLFGGRGLHTILPPNENGDVGVLADGGISTNSVPPSLTRGQEGNPSRRFTAGSPEGYGELTAIALPKKGMFITAGLPEPHWWLMNPAGQMSRTGNSLRFPMPAGSVCGRCGPSTGRETGVPRPRQLETPHREFHYGRARGGCGSLGGFQPEDATHFIGATRSGRLSRFQLQSEPSPHVFELSHVDRGQSSDFPPAGPMKKSIRPSRAFWNVGTPEPGKRIGALS